MPKIFSTIDKIEPAYKMVYNVVLFLCKVLLVTDILITSMAVLGRFVPFVPDPSWSEEVVLTLMAYMAVLSAALAIRQDSHIRITVFDRYLPKKMIVISDLIIDIALLILAIIMIVEGWKFSWDVGLLGFYISLPWLSNFWKYFPVPLAGVAMLIFELELVYKHIKKIYQKEEKEEVADGFK